MHFNVILILVKYYTTTLHKTNLRIILIEVCVIAVILQAYYIVIASYTYILSNTEGFGSVLWLTMLRYFTIATMWRIILYSLILDEIELNEIEVDDVLTYNASNSAAIR